MDVAISGSTATLWLDNQRQFNALTKDMTRDLISAFTQLSSNDAVRTIVLRGAGGNFCAGIAIDQMEQVLFDRDADGALINHFELLDRLITESKKTTIAVVEGNCFGGAWQLASACDIQLAADNVRLAITPAKIGLVFPRLGLERLVRAVGEHRAKYLLFSGAQIPVAQAESWGMFTKVVPAADLEAELSTLLGQLDANSPYSLARSKEAINLGAGDDWWEALWEENASNADLVEGRAAFMERRKPKYTVLPLAPLGCQTQERQ